MLPISFRSSSNRSAVRKPLIFIPYEPGHFDIEDAYQLGCNIDGHGLEGRVPKCHHAGYVEFVGDLTPEDIQEENQIREKEDSEREDKVKQARAIVKSLPLKASAVAQAIALLGSRNYPRIAEVASQIAGKTITRQSVYYYEQLAKERLYPVVRRMSPQQRAHLIKMGPKAGKRLLFRECRMREKELGIQRGKLKTPIK